MEKYYNDKGEVAVLVSYGYGAGWSTDSGLGDFALFDKTLVQMCLDCKPVEDVDKYLESIGFDEDFYTGGWRGVEVEWVPQGTAFIIEEYDGAETLEYISNINYSVA